MGALTDASFSFNRFFGGIIWSEWSGDSVNWRLEDLKKVFTLEIRVDRKFWEDLGYDD